MSLALRVNRVIYLSRKGKKGKKLTIMWILRMKYFFDRLFYFIYKKNVRRAIREGLKRIVYHEGADGKNILK